MGDVPYELRSLSGELTAAYPALLFFRGTAALGLLDATSRVLPILAPRTVLRDPAPRMRPPGVEAPRAR